MIIDRKRVQSSSQQRKIKQPMIFKTNKTTDKKKLPTFHTLKSLKTTFNEHISEFGDEEQEKYRQQVLYDQLLESVDQQEFDQGPYISPWRITPDCECNQPITPKKCPSIIQNRILFEPKSNSLNQKKQCFKRSPTKIQKIFPKKEFHEEEEKEKLDEIRRIINQYFVKHNQLEQKNASRDSCQFYFQQNNYIDQNENSNLQIYSNPYFKSVPFQIQQSSYSQKSQDHLSNGSNGYFPKQKSIFNFLVINFYKIFLQDGDQIQNKKYSKFYEKKTKIIIKKNRNISTNKQLKISNTFEV